MTTETSRRALVGAMIAAAPIIAMTPAAASVGSVDARLKLLIERWREAHQRHEDFIHVHVTPAEEKMFAAKRKAEALPHHRTVNTFTNLHGEARSLTTEHPWSVAQVRTTLEHTSAEHQFDDYRAVAEELIAADDARKAEAQRIIDAESGAEHLEAVEAEAHRLLDIETDALHAIVDFPATTIVDLHTKIEIIQSNDWWELSTDEITADVRRLAGVA